jgi:hypothetical protein
MELITHTSGDFDEAINWLRELDIEYGLTTAAYTIDDFIEDLLKSAYVQPKGDGTGDEKGMSLTAKTEKLLREHALKQIFGKLKKKQVAAATKPKVSGKEQTIRANLKPTNLVTHLRKYL